MNKKIAIKRMASVMVCMAVTAAVGFNGLLASAATGAVLNFEDYSSDTEATNELFASKAAYYWNDSNYYADNLTPTDVYKDLDLWAQANMSYATDSRRNTMYNNIASISPKDANGNLVSMKNFSALLDNIRVGDNTSQVTGAVWLGLRQQTSGKFLAGTGDYQFDKGQAFVRVTNTGITIASGEQLTALSASAEAAAVEDYSFSETATTYLRTAGKQFDIAVKVLGNKCTVTVNDQWDTGIFKETYTETLEASAPTCGYFTFGVGDTSSYAFYKASVTNLDSSGTAIDFDSVNIPTAQSSLPVSRTVAVGASYEDANMPEKVAILDAEGDRHSVPVVWDSTTFDTSSAGTITLYGTLIFPSTLAASGVITATANITAISNAENEGFYADLKPYPDDFDDIFAVTWNHESTYETNHVASDFFKKVWSDYTHRFYSDTYPIAGEYYSRIAGMTPKDANGKITEIRNFELTFNYRVPFGTSAQYGAVWIGFRQKEAGHFFNGYKNLNTEQSFVRVTNTGITIAAGDDITNDLATAEDVLMSSDNTALLAKDGTLVTVYVKVVGNNCEVAVSNTSTKEVLLSYSETLSSSAPETGYLSVGIGDRQMHIADLSVTKLDESGNQVDFTNYTYGDVNGDSDVDILDLVRLKKYVAAAVTAEDIYKKNANCEIDDAIDSLDLAALRQILLGIA